MADRKSFSEKSGVTEDAIGYSDYIAYGAWNVDDVLRLIYEQAGKMLGREFPYPGDEEN
jgi:hypothetical protein